MLAYTDAPGGRYFKTFGPATKAECEAWLGKERARLYAEGVRCCDGAIISNAVARREKWHVGGDYIFGWRENGTFNFYSEMIEVKGNFR